MLFSAVTPDYGLIQDQHCRTILLTTLNNVTSKTLFNAVFITSEQVIHFCPVVTICNEQKKNEDHAIQENNIGTIFTSSFELFQLLFVYFFFLKTVFLKHVMIQRKVVVICTHRYQTCNNVGGNIGSPNNSDTDLLQQDCCWQCKTVSVLLEKLCNKSDSRIKLVTHC